MSAGDKWDARGTGPVVRPYALTGGRTESAAGETLDLIAIIVATESAAAPGGPLDLTPEHRKILGLCREAAAVADVASDMALPLGVVRVLLGDLILQGRITVLQQRRAGEPPPADLLREVLHGLRAL